MSGQPGRGGSSPGRSAGPGHAAEGPLAPPREEGYTGVIIDCRGLGLKRTKSPRVFTPAKTMVYGPQMVSREYALSIGVVSYDTSPAGMYAFRRAGSRPLTVRAVGVTGPYQAYPVVSTSDAARLERANAAWDLLRTCRVVFVLD